MCSFYLAQSLDALQLPCRSDQMAVTISSPHLELTFPNGNDGSIVKLPVFSAKDSIGGTISVNPAAYPNSSGAKILVSVGLSYHTAFTLILTEYLIHVAVGRCFLLDRTTTSAARADLHTFETPQSQRESLYTLPSDRRTQTRLLLLLSNPSSLG